MKYIQIIVAGLLLLGVFWICWQWRCAMWDSRADMAVKKHVEELHQRTD